MQTASSETESKSLDVSICVHHYTLRAPCPKGQGTCYMFCTDHNARTWCPLLGKKHIVLKVMS